MTVDLETEPLSARLRRTSMSFHGRRRVDPETAFTSALLSGRLSRGGYVELVGQHYFLYDAMERAWDRLASHPVVRRFDFAELRRRDALEEDLRFLIGPNWSARITPNPVMRRYVDRLEKLDPDDSIAFIAHQYTRYIGDLSGGQAIAKVLRDKYGMRPGAGMSFYRFERIADPLAFKDRYRAVVDATEWDENEQDRLITEVVATYQLNFALFAQLAADTQAGE